MSNILLLELTSNGDIIQTKIDSAVIEFGGSTNHVVTRDSLGGLTSTLFLPVSQGGTNSNISLNNNRFVVSSGGKIVETLAVAANRVVVSNSLGLPAAATATSTEVDYLVGVTSAIQAQLDSKNSYILPVTSVKTSAYTVLSTDYIVRVNTTSAAVTITLPATNVLGQVIVIKDVGGNAGTNNITISSTGTIDGTASPNLMNSAFESVTLVGDGVNWFII